jgi:phosphoglycolate phosphatase
MEITASKPITVVCCGLVGTLVADDGLIERSFAEAIATQGVVAGTSAYAKRMTQVHQARGRAPADVLGTLFPDNEARAQAALLAFHRTLADAIRRTEFVPLPGAVAALQQLSAAGVQVSVLTSLPRQALDAVVDAARLRRHFRLALSAEEVPRGFPWPDLALTAMLRCGASAVQELAVIHSTGAGVESGRRSGAGIVAGVVTGPHSAARLRSAGADHVIRSFADVARMIMPDGPVGAVGSVGAVGPVGAVGLGGPGGLESVSIPAQAPYEHKTLGS